MQVYFYIWFSLSLSFDLAVLVCDFGLPRRLCVLGGHVWISKKTFKGCRFTCNVGLACLVFMSRGAVLDLMSKGQV